MRIHVGQVTSDRCVWKRFQMHITAICQHARFTFRRFTIRGSRSLSALLRSTLRFLMVTSRRVAARLAFGNIELLLCLVQRSGLQPAVVLLDCLCSISSVAYCEQDTCTCTGSAPCSSRLAGVMPRLCDGYAVQMNTKLGGAHPAADRQERNVGRSFLGRPTGVKQPICKASQELCLVWRLETWRWMLPWGQDSMHQDQAHGAAKAVAGYLKHSGGIDARSSEVFVEA